MDMLMTRFSGTILMDTFGTTGADPEWCLRCSGPVLEMNQRRALRGTVCFPYKAQDARFYAATVCKDS